MQGKFGIDYVLNSESLMKLIEITIVLLASASNGAALAVTCDSSAYTADANVTGMAGPLPVASLQTGNLLPTNGNYREVINVTVEADGTYTLTTVALPNGPVGPSGVTIDQCD